MPEGQTQPKKSPIGALISIAIIIAVAWYFWGGGLEHKVASDQIKEYEFAKKNGTRMDICVHAQLVTAAYMQAKDEENYRQWKATEKADCAAAGLPDDN